jgi:Spy/CpxP family protein refolding chaperone
MNNNRFAQNVTAAAAALLLLIATPGRVRADSPQSHPSQPPITATAGPQKAASYEEDFAGLDLSDDQKTEIGKIRQDTEARKAAVAKSATLNQDQKDAMILGYTRLQYSQMFRTLTPIQQKVVRKRIQDRKAAEVGSSKQQAPRN